MAFRASWLRASAKGFVWPSGNFLFFFISEIKYKTNACQQKFGWDFLWKVSFFQVVGFKRKKKIIFFSSKLNLWEKGRTNISWTVVLVGSVAWMQKGNTTVCGNILLVLDRSPFHQKNLASAEPWCHSSLFPFFFCHYKIISKFNLLFTYIYMYSN